MSHYGVSFNCSHDAFSKSKIKRHMFTTTRHRYEFLSFSLINEDMIEILLNNMV